MKRGYNARFVRSKILEARKFEQDGLLDKPQSGPKDNFEYNTPPSLFQVEGHSSQNLFTFDSRWGASHSFFRLWWDFKMVKISSLFLV